MIWDLQKFDNTALMDDTGNTISYIELKEETERLYNTIGRRCQVFLLCENSIGSILGYVTFLNHGIVPVMLNRHLDKGLLDELIKKYSPDYLWVPEDETIHFAEMECVFKAKNYCLLKTDFEERYALNEELALLLTTSGSTGSPKFVRQSYLNIVSNTESIIEYLKIDRNERPITTLPMNYTYGLSIINTHLYVGATILLTDKSLMQKEFWEFFKKRGATSFGGVPYTYEMLDKLRFFKMELPTLTTMTQAGGKITPELHEKLALYANQNFKKFVVMYGQCEATARMGYLPYEKAVEKKGSMGIAIPGGAFHLVDEYGKDITEPFMTGELVYEGKNVTLGYAERGEDLIKGDERHGVLNTGDMAQFDNDGYYYIVGRKKRFLKIYGNRVNLDEMDRLIKGNFDGIDVACTGIDDNMHIYITESSMKDEIIKFITHVSGLNKAAFQIRILDEIPKNDAGKVLYSKLESMQYE